MRLTQIKLSGFKSFVDPTHFQIPGQLVGVVGPNGCGKSNIIDAVRWVLGESKASELRGESMQDVIFNGSGQRKPAGRASVELIFDNSLGRAAGQWNQYAEIAVKRVLTRDGGSNYFINNQVVRRRDIQDIFLGTGLGPRAYAIIGQGMIARIIEAKPEELRVFLEEAAGVSKYKERRRETENRLSGTRENLTRVEDILRELNTNLEKLAAQAVVAQQYRDLQNEYDDKQKILWIVRRNEAQAEQQRYQNDILKNQTQFEAQTADLRQLEAALEQLRAAHYAAGDALHKKQGELYEANAKVSALEAEIKFVIEARNRAQTQVSTAQAQHDDWLRQTQQLENELEKTQRARADALLALEQAQASLDDQTILLPDAEQALQAAQQRVDQVRAQVASVEQALQLESAQQRHADRNLQNLIMRRERLAQERAQLIQPDVQGIEALQIVILDTQERLAEHQNELEIVENSLPQLQAACRAKQETVAQETTQFSQIEARLTALNQLQESLQTHDKLQPWLMKHELLELPRLWQRLHIATGWETALESVLRESIAGLELRQIDWVKGFFNDAPPGKLTFFSSQSVASHNLVQTPSGLTSLLSLLELNDPNLHALLSDWIGHVYVAESAEIALEQRRALPPSAVFVTKAGHVIGRNAVRFYASDSEQAGMLARQQEIENLTKQGRAQQLLADEAKSALIRAEAALRVATTHFNDLRSAVAQLTQSLHAQQMQLQQLTQQHSQMQLRSEQLEVEATDLRMQIEYEEGLRLESEAKFEQLDIQLAAVQAEFEDEQITLAAVRKTLFELRENLRIRERAAQEAQFNQRNLDNRFNELTRSQQLAVSQAEQLANTITQLEIELQQLGESAAQNGLQEALRVRGIREQSLAQARIELDDLSAQLRALDEARLQNEQGLEPLRVRINDLQLKEQAARLNQEQFVQQLSESQADLHTLETKLATLAAIKPAGLQSELHQIQVNIAALGAVNLAALEELTAGRERKTFLDAQLGDLTTAINTLEDAIRKIDQETRALLQDTFDAVNQYFAELFPALFGGGHARLSMTGEEILDAGVQVLAQPPGKKNSTIHLLSGGEKALTATALVFALFQLNPAPFCLLDEVDAPLDDANTERFCQLVKKMSVQTQFLFISHNKIAMEMAQQLIGVTMQEQGVSRIVAVDMETATQFVGSVPEIAIQTAYERVAA